MSNYNFGKLVGDLIGLGVFPPKRNFTLQQMSDYFGYVSPMNFGAVGDGAANDFQPVVDAIDYGRINQIPVNGLGKTYKIDSTLPTPGYILHDITLDGSDIVADSVWISNSQVAFESAQALTVDLRQGGNALTVVGHGYSVGDVVLIQSTLVAETANNSLAAHWGRVNAVPTADTFTIEESSYVNLLVADTATVRRLPQVYCEFKNVKIIGGPAVLNGLRIFNYTDPEFHNMHFEGCTDRALAINQCFNPRVFSASIKDASNPVLGYGVVIGASGNSRVDFVQGQNCRHVLTYGAYNLIPCTGGSFGDVVGTKCIAAVMDTHPPAYGLSHTGKIVGDMRTDAGEDGVTWQAAGGNINVELTGSVARHGVLVQPWYVAAAFDRFPSFDIKLRSTATIGSSGVVLDTDGAASIDTINIDNVSVSTLQNISFAAGTQAIESVTISGHGRSLTSRGIFFQGTALTDVGYISQTGNWLCAAAEAVYYFMGTDAAVRTTDIAIASGKMSGGTYGLRVGNKAAAKLASTFPTGSTGATLANPAPATITVLT